MASLAENRAARRQEKLDNIVALIEGGTLTVRQMTAAERKLNPARTETPLPKRPRRA
jgi:hypothetical protein